MDAAQVDTLIDIAEVTGLAVIIDSNGARLAGQAEVARIIEEAEEG
jgi:hypothetical protein